MVDTTGTLPDQPHGGTKNMPAWVASGRRLRSKNLPMDTQSNITPQPLHDIALIDGPCYAHVDAVGDPALGAEAIFLGRTRHEEHPVHGPLKALHYSAYETMAIAQLTQLADQAIEAHDAAAVRIHHALGHVAPGQISVIVQVRCGHRAEAFAACRWLIDALKERVPIWKQEIWQSSQTWPEGHLVHEAEVRTL